MSNETEQRFLLREIESLKQRLEKLEIQEKGIVVWKSWTPTLTGWSGTPSFEARYTVIGKFCAWSLRIIGTSNSASATATLPFYSANISGFQWGGANFGTRDNGTYLASPGRWFITANSNIVTFNKDFAGTGFIDSGTKEVWAIGFYEIA